MQPAPSPAEYAEIARLVDDGAAQLKEKSMTTTQVVWDDLNFEEQSILGHTRYRTQAGRYCGDSEEMQRLVALGLMESAGRVSWVPDEYFRLTDAGKLLLPQGDDVNDCEN